MASVLLARISAMLLWGRPNIGVHIASRFIMLMR